MLCISTAVTCGLIMQGFITSAQCKKIKFAKALDCIFSKCHWVEVTRCPNIVHTSPVLMGRWREGNLAQTHKASDTLPSRHDTPLIHVLALMIVIQIMLCIFLVQVLSVAIYCYHSVTEPSWGKCQFKFNRQVQCVMWLSEEACHMATIL